MNAGEVKAYKKHGELTISSQSMMTYGWCVTDVTPLLSPAGHRGSSVKIPGAPGRIGMPRRKDETTYQLPMLIDTRVTRTGAATASPAAGLIANVQALESLATGPVSTGTGTRAVVLGSLSGSAYVGLTLGDEEGDVFRAVLTLTFPLGGLI